MNNDFLSYIKLNYINMTSNILDDLNLSSIKKEDTENSSEDENDDVLKSKFDINTKKIYDINKNTFLVKLSIRDIIETSNWCYNREIKEDRVEELFNDFIGYLHDNKNISPIWIFTGIYDEYGENNNIFMIDGQHRKKVLEKYLSIYDIDMNCNMEFICILYEINYCETHNKKNVIELFKKINNNRQFNKEELPDDFISDLVNSLSLENVFKNGIKYNKNNEKAHEPCIHKKELNTFFNKYKDELKEMEINIIIQNLKKINNILSLKTYKELYGNKSKKKESYHTKAKQIKFYLNLKNSKYPPEEWIKYIKYPDNLTTYYM